jgi:hypothetical protein
VVLRRAEGDDHVPVGQCEEARLLAGQELLDHHLRARAAERAAEHVGQRRLGFGGGPRDHHALARRKPIRLDHHRQPEAPERRARGRLVGEAAIGGGGDILPRAQILGEALRSFKLRGGRRRPEDEDARLGKLVGKPIDQRLFRPHHDEPDIHVRREGDHRFEMRGIKRDQLGMLSDSRIAGRRVEPGELA